MIDLDALEAAGIANAHARRDLLEYLDALGFSAADMVDAERRGRLFALSGDAIISSGPAVHSLRSAAESIGRPLAEIEHAWAVLGLTVADADQVALSQADVDGLQTWSDLADVAGEEASLGVLRVLGAAMARFAEAESSAIRAGVPSVQINYTADEVATARAFNGVATFVPRIGAMIDAVHRQHLDSARTYFEGVLQDTSASVVCGVGFVDLSGFTSLTQLMAPDELSGLLSTFNATVSDVVHADGGRVVKLIGDAVMWVSSTPAQLVAAAADLVAHPKAIEAGLQVRAGLAYGPTLALDGDYFGRVVNLAARLCAAAAPGQILVTEEVRGALTGWGADPTGPLTLRGFDDPIPAYSLSRGVETSLRRELAGGDTVEP